MEESRCDLRLDIRLDLEHCLFSRCRQLRIGEGAKKTRTRKQWKDLKKKKRTTWGTGKRAANRAAKKAAAS